MLQIRLFLCNSYGLLYGHYSVGRTGKQARLLDARPNVARSRTGPYSPGRQSSLFFTSFPGAPTPLRPRCRQGNVGGGYLLTDNVGKEEDKHICRATAVAGLVGDC